MSNVTGPNSKYREIAMKSKASQGPDEMEWLLNKVGAIKPKVIVEIGVHLGHSMKAWQDAFKPKRMVGIDGETNETIEDYIKSKRLKANFLIADSHDQSTLEAVSVYLGGEKVDFLFIDGDHSYEGVKQDYEMYSPLVRKGGIIAFHDAGITDHPLVDVYKYWRDVTAKNKPQAGKQNFDFIHQDSNGVGILYVK